MMMPLLLLQKDVQSECHTRITPACAPQVDFSACIREVTVAVTSAINTMTTAHSIWLSLVRRKHNSSCDLMELCRSRSFFVWGHLEPYPVSLDPS